MHYGITHYKDKFAGHITLVGNGPSLDFNKIGAPSMAMNSISMAFDRTEWRPDYYVCISRELRENKKMMRRVTDVLETGIPCFLNVNYYPALGDWPNANYIGLAIQNHEPKTGDWLQNGYWFNSFATTMLPAAQIADYMGFNEIRFVGCDGYKPYKGDNDINHFDNTYNTGLLPDCKDMSDPERISEMNRRMQLVHKHIQRFVYVRKSDV